MAMTATMRSQVTDEQVADLERCFGRDSVVELTYKIAHENMRSRMNSAIGNTEQGFSSGDACRVPWANETRTRRPAWSRKEEESCQHPEAWPASTGASRTRCF
jgi:hypothetical protein